MAETADPIPQLIVIGSSAGGIDALSTIVSTLPEDMPAPILVAQHLSPNRPSHLQEILQRQTKLGVASLDGGPAELKNGMVYVLPAGSGAEFTDHEIRLVEREPHGPTPSVDHLFSSAAQVFGEGLVAVILTGTGSDGAIGARDVKLAGGTVIVQNPETASYPGMPNALAPTSIDIVAELEAIGPLLHDLVSGAYTPSKPDEERLLSAFLDQLRERSGIDFNGYKRATILRRLQRRMAATGTTNLRGYVQHVQSDPDEYQRLASSFLIKVTQFFRDRDLFKHLEEVVIPQLILDARERDGELRLWSAGCATGEEAYSLAMLVVDALGDELEKFNVRIFATDVDGEAIMFARRGLYPAASIAELPEDIVERHFVKVSDGYEVRKRIRTLTVFGQHDLGQRAPFPRVDLALCRNVLIYFTMELQKRALQLFAFSLRDGGFLVLGKAESTTPLPHYFVLSQPRLKIFRRQGDRILVPPARIRGLAPVVQLRSAAPRRTSWAGVGLTRGPGLDRASSATERADSLLLRLPVGIVVIDRNYDVQSINTAARRMLSIHVPAIGDDLVHLLPASVASEGRIAIDAAFRREVGEATIEVPTVVAEGTELRTIHLSTHPLLADGATGPIESVVVVSDDVTDAMTARRDLESSIALSATDRSKAAERSREMADSNVELLSANQVLTTANTELRSSNEELLVANEEVQAATEEVETLNEELQATNEELETLNEELQATIEELNTTNDDLEARSVELRETTLTLDRLNQAAQAERSRVTRVLDGLDYGFALIGPDGQPALTNAPYREILGGGELLDDDGVPLGAEQSPAARAARGEQFEERFRIRKGRRRLGAFEIQAEPLGPDDPGYMMLIVRRADEPG